MMAFASAIAKPLVATAMLALCIAPACAQSAGPPPLPAHNRIQLEAKPPDEPSAAASPDVQLLPDAGPSTGALPPSADADGDDDSSGDDSAGHDSSGNEGGGDTPVAAQSVAHPPEIVTYVVPVYPPAARSRGIEGRVRLEVIVDESGKVEDNVQVLDSVPMLDQAAVDAAHQWTFTPARDADGNPVRVRMEVPVPFALH
jgi:protein TonB